MKKYLLLTLMPLLSSCGAEEISYGTYEQIKPFCDVTSPDEQNEQCNFETRYAFSFEVTPEYFRTFYQEEIYSETDYQLHGRTLVADDETGTKWVVFFEDTEFAHMSAFSYKRASNE